MLPSALGLGRSSQGAGAPCCGPSRVVSLQTAATPHVSSRTMVLCRRRSKLLPGHEQTACLRPERTCRPGLPHKANAANGCREEFAIGLPAEARHLQDTDDAQLSTMH